MNHLAFAWALMGAITAHFAKKRGRNYAGWFAIGMFLGIFGLLALFLLPSLQKEEAAPSLEGDPAEAGPQPSPWTMADTAWALVEWYYVDDNREQQGAFAFQKLKEFWENQQILDGTYVWSEGMKTWQKICEVPGLKDALVR